jgi:membrane-associated phospholipid phosphatase
MNNNMKELLYDFYGYNQGIFYLLNEFCISYKLQVPLLYISRIFDIENFAIYYILAVAILWVQRRITAPSYDFMTKLGTSYACFGLLYAFLKFTINMPRPFCSLPQGSFTTIMDIAHERCLSSFPSSHTGLAILIALNIWPYIGSGMRIFSAFIIGLVALSRVGLAMHYPADIFYSIFIAILVFAISKLVYRLFEDNLIKWVKEYIIK